MVNDAYQRPPITDSPWFWVLVFSLVGLAGLAAIHDKYGKRQAGIERQYQARERTAEQVAVAGKDGEAADTIQPTDVPLPAYATPGHNLISIWPLFALLSVLGLVAAIMLSRERSRKQMWLFENPVAIWCGGAVLLTLAIVVHLQMRTRASLLAIAVIVLLTAALLIAERLIVTPREEVQQTLDQLAARIEANDLPGVLTFIVPASKAVRADAESLMPLVTVNRAAIVSTPEITVNMDGQPATADVSCQGLVDVTVKQNGMQGPYLDRVKIHFVRSGNRWLIESYTPQKDWHRGAAR
jgi:hypothetical protein